eukprot:GEMP01031895.1.p1 GENE.GEMP01031895.1~~GEMP01031895.1.p1  ORF type:complete len:308 (+),score=41.97 GEMP01031895.1:40-924(+)
MSTRERESAIITFGEVCSSYGTSALPTFASCRTSHMRFATSAHPCAKTVAEKCCSVMWTPPRCSIVMRGRYHSSPSLHRRPRSTPALNHVYSDSRVMAALRCPDSARKADSRATALPLKLYSARGSRPESPNPGFSSYRSPSHRELFSAGLSTDVSSNSVKDKVDRRIEQILRNPGAAASPKTFTEITPPRRSSERGKYRKHSSIPASQNTKELAFVRLNHFLLRAHLTSLLSAMLEEGFMEKWEKENLCEKMQCPERGEQTMKELVKIYSAFVDAADLPSFVNELRAFLCAAK